MNINQEDLDKKNSGVLINEFVKTLSHIIDITESNGKEIAGAEYKNLYVYYNMHTGSNMAISKINGVINIATALPKMWVKLEQDSRLKFLLSLKMQSDALNGYQLTTALNEHQEIIDYKKSKKGLL